MKKILLLLSFLFVMVDGEQQVSAEGDASYSVSPILSEHQTEGIDTFYDIRWTLGATDNFSVKVTNQTDVEKTYELVINKARTNKNGMIDYTNNTPEDPSVAYKLTEMVKLPKEVTVAPNSSKEVAGYLTFPNQDFNGILMAGIHVSEKKVANSQASVSNTVAYNLPFVVRGNIDKRPTPIIEMMSLKVNQFSSDVYSVDAMLENKGPNLLKEVAMDAQVLDVKNEEIMAQSSQLDITPETTFSYPVKLPSDIKAGSYTLVLKVKHSEANQWEFKETFTISKEEAQAIKQSAHKDGLNWLKNTIIMAFILLLLLVIILAVKLMKKDK